MSTKPAFCTRCSRSKGYTVFSYTSLPQAVQGCLEGGGSVCSTCLRGCLEGGCVTRCASDGYGCVEQEKTQNRRRAKDTWKLWTVPNFDWDGRKWLRVPTYAPDKCLCQWCRIKVCNEQRRRVGSNTTTITEPQPPTTPTTHKRDRSEGGTPSNKRSSTTPPTTSTRPKAASAKPGSSPTPPTSSPATSAPTPARELFPDDVALAIRSMPLEDKRSLMKIYLRTDLSIAVSRVAHFLEKN